MKVLTMAHAVQLNGVQIRGGQKVDAFFASLWARFLQYRLYRQTVHELQSLPTRELADLGLTRSSIRAAAYEAVYGA